MRSDYVVVCALAMALGLPTCEIAQAQQATIQTITDMYKQHHEQIRTLSEAVEPGSQAQEQLGIRHARAGTQSAANQSSTGIPARDPFALTPLMLQSGGSFSGGSSAGPMPALKLRGIARRGGISVALIEIDGMGTLVLRVGETVTVRNDLQPLVLQLKRIHASSVEMEAGQTKQIVVR